MVSDPTKPLLKLEVSRPQERQRGAPRPIPQPASFPIARQTSQFSPIFNRLSEVLARDESGLELRSDPTAMAPERLLVFEVRGSLSNFAQAAQRIVGLELVDEEELKADDEDSNPVAYLIVPDVRALAQLESLWRRWQSNNLQIGETPWRNLFSLLRDLRPWGPADRVQTDDAGILAEELEGRADHEQIRLEIELVFRRNVETATIAEFQVVDVLEQNGGALVSRARIEAISYHALLVDLPVSSVRHIIGRQQESIAGLDPVMHIRPQSVATSIELADAQPADYVERKELGTPILAVLDGVPIAAHPLLRDHLIVDDQFGLEPEAPVDRRVHGTAMSSLIIHGDRNAQSQTLPRKIHHIPVLGSGDSFPSNRLIVDLVYSAVVRMRSGDEPTASDVLIVNLSLGNARRPFHGQLSGWARLLDRLAYHYGILFIVSAGNHSRPFGVRAYATSIAFEDADAADRREQTLRAIGDIVPDRRLLSPAETVNGITVGACNTDNVAPVDRALARALVDPYGEFRMSNPSSALGPGFAGSVKPDVLLSGAREHLRVVGNNGHIEVEPSGPGRSTGLRVAGPPRGGLENTESYTNGTSAAAALISRTAHQIHDALEMHYGANFLSMTSRQRAVLLKALLVHTARWPTDAAELIRGVLGPADPRQHVKQKDNIRRFLGFGIVEPGDAVYCAADRATFWATGEVEADKVVNVEVPIPVAMGGKALPHGLFVTLAWFTPTSPGRKSYRTVRLKVLEPDQLTDISVQADKNQPDSNQTSRGTIFMRCWQGDRAFAGVENMSLSLQIQRSPDQGEAHDEPVPFGLAATLTMPGVVEIYEQVRARLGIAPRARA